MDAISDLMKIAQGKIGSEPSESKPLDPAIVGLINDIFIFFYSVCRGFEKQYSDQKRLNIEKTQWMKAFIHEGIRSKAQVEQGIIRTRRETPIYTPTIGQFLDWCTPSLNALGVPTTDQAYDEACKNSHPSADKNWSHKLVAHAAKLTGSYLLSTSARSVSYPVFQRNYEISIRDWRGGKKIDEIKPPIALEKIKDPVQNAESRRKSLYEAYVKLGRLDLAAKYVDGEEISEI